MAQLNLILGTPNNEDGDFVRDAFVKTEANFTELYAKVNTSDFNNNGSDGISTFVETDELGITAFSNDYNDLNNLPIIPNAPTGLEAIDEGNGIGWRLIGRDPLNYGNIGNNAIDLSKSLFPSTTNGATGASSFALGIDVKSSGITSISMGYKLDNSSLDGVTIGINNTISGYANSVFGVGQIVAGMAATVIGQAADVASTSFLDWNAFPTKPIFVVGNGTIQNADINYTVLTRSNAFKILYNGEITAPSLTTALIDAELTGKVLITKEYADTNYSGGGVTTFAALSDVSLGTLSINNLLRWNGTEWVNSTAASLNLVDRTATNFMVSGSVLDFQIGSQLRTFSTPRFYNDIILNNTTLTVDENIANDNYVLKYDFATQSINLQAETNVNTTIPHLGYNNTNQTIWNYGKNGIVTNTSFGTRALEDNTTGYSNSSFGVNSLFNNSSGHNNSAFGSASLGLNTIGNDNSAFGVLALQANSGSRNTGVGVSSLVFNTTGNNNLALGYLSGTHLSDGSTANTISDNSVFLGAYSKSSINNQTNQIVIGYDAIGNGSNTATLGNSSITDTYLRGQLHNSSYGSGANTGTPTYALQVDAGGNIIEGALGGGGTMATTTFTPYLTITSTDGQAAVEELKDELDAAVIASGTDVAPMSYTTVGGETTWAIGQTIPSQHKLFINGLKVIEGVDYTITGTTITYIGTILAGEEHELYFDIAVPTTYNASEVSIADAGGLITATNVEGALQENRTAINLNTAKVGVTNELKPTDIDTLAELNAIITDATLIDTSDARLSDARTPLSHTHTASEITNFDTEVANNTDVAANTAKVSNANHTGDVTGDTALTIQPAAISGKSANAGLTGTEELLINNAGTLEKTTTQAIADLVGGGSSNIPFWSRDFRFEGFGGRYYYTRGANSGFVASQFTSTTADDIPTIHSSSITSPAGWTIFKDVTITNIKLNYSTLYSETYVCYLVVKRFPAGVETNSILWTSADIVTTASSIGSLDVTGLSISLNENDRIYIVTTRTATTEGAVTGIMLSIGLYE